MNHTEGGHPRLERKQRHMQLCTQYTYIAPIEGMGSCVLVGVGKMTRQGGHEGSWEHQMTHDVRWYGSEGTG